MVTPSRLLSAAAVAFALSLAGGAVPPLAAPAAAQGVARGVEAAGTWIRGDDVSRAETLIATLRQAEVHALPVGRYDPEGLSALLASGDRAAAERALTRAFLAYAEDVSTGLLDPASAASNVRRGKPRFDAAAARAAAASAPDIAAYLMTLPPQDPDYFALMRRYAQLRARPDWGPIVPSGRTLRYGDSGPEVAALRRRLAAMGDHDAEGVDAPERFDGRLAADVRAFQRRHGLNEDGEVGARTFDALNASPVARAEQIAVNLERIRWMNRDLGQRRIIVNQPDYSVTLFDGATPLFHERVIVGEPQHQTPEFSDEMEYLVLNPSWNVPRSIATKELLPQLREDPGLLARQNMVLVRSDGGPVPADPSTHDFTQYSASSFPYRIQQRPDDDNALGEVKFMFPNNYAIYLHDTPSKQLFSRDARAFSHGCVRVQDPLRLAEILLEGQKPDARAYIDRVLAADRETYVQLDRHIPVHLVYRTAWIDPVDGRPNFRADIYGRDAQVTQALRAAGVSALRV